jgi:large subunit ribosomal protein L3
MKALLGRKIGMSQVFSPEGEVVPVTLIQAEPNTVTLKRVAERDGYQAVQVALLGKKRPAAVREFKGELAEEVKELTVEQFSPGDLVEIVGVSKGKGFQGVVKRHGFAGGPASHGHTDWERKGGSIGSRFPQHTIKGKKMAGRMGADRVTIKKVKVMNVDSDLKVLAVKGPVPGRRGTIVEIFSV